MSGLFLAFEAIYSNMTDLMAGWQSGHAAACKAVDGGSIPPSASIIFRLSPNCPGGVVVDGSRKPATEVEVRER